MGSVWLSNLSCSGDEASIADCAINVTANGSLLSLVGADKWSFAATAPDAAEAKDAGVCCWQHAAFMGETGLRTRHAFGHIFSTISHLDREGQEVEPDFCCQEHAGECTDGVPVDGEPRLVRCYSSVAQGGKCTYARGPFEVLDVGDLPCDNNRSGNFSTNCDEQTNLIWRAPADTGGHAIIEYSIEAAPMLWNGSHFVPSSDNFYVAVPRTESSINASIVTELVNFRPYQFRVSAINALGLSSSFGPGRPQVYSRPSPPITPIVSAPSPPRNGRGAAGNRRAYLQWDPPTWDGGRQVVQYLLQVSHPAGLGSGTFLPAVTAICKGCPAQAHLADLGTDRLPPDGLFPITEASPQFTAAPLTTTAPGSTPAPGARRMIMMRSTRPISSELVAYGRRAAKLVNDGDSGGVNPLSLTFEVSTNPTAKAPGKLSVGYETHRI